MECVTVVKLMMGTTDSYIKSARLEAVVCTMRTQEEDTQHRHVQGILRSNKMTKVEIFLKV